jgi:hypothetical protein
MKTSSISVKPLGWESICSHYEYSSESIIIETRMRKSSGSGVIEEYTTSPIKQFLTREGSGSLKFYDETKKNFVCWFGLFVNVEAE